MTTDLQPSTLEQAARTFRASLLRRDEASLRRVMAAYRPVLAGIQAEIADLTAQIAEARAAGTVIRPAWFRQQGRLQALEQQVYAQWRTFAAAAFQEITATQREAVEAGLRDGAALLRAADDTGRAALLVGGDVARLNTEALTELVGTLSDGSPLRALLTELGTEAAEAVEAALLRGVAIGYSPRRTAKAIRDALGGSLHRALTIARTEHLRAYRTATLERFRLAGDTILRGWQWRASPSSRTCPLCLAMDGREFGLDEPFASHANCRCSPIPLVRGRAAPERQFGSAWFAQQPADVQRGILGPGALKLYQEGRITLDDLVVIRRDPRWGPTLARRSLPDALAAAAQRAAA